MTIDDNVTKISPQVIENTSDRGNLDEIIDLLSQPLSPQFLKKNPVPLPSRDALFRIVDQIRAVLFPFHLGNPELGQNSLRYFIGHNLSEALDLLQNQIERERWLLGNELHLDSNLIKSQAQETIKGFIAQLPQIKSLLESDVIAAYHGDPAAKNLDEILFCYPGVTAISYHRIAHALFLLNSPLLARIIAEIGHSLTGIDIHPGASIGNSFFIDHGTGVVIGETTIIGDRVRIYQAVTLGAKSFPRDNTGSVIKGNARHPIIEDDVVIYSGATILGRITVGKGATIGGNVWLTRSVPPGSFVSQAKVRQEIFDEGAGI
ncbi:serine O-acetyltransferase EpsC [Geminocystis sp. CENA526]|uniref:serine O-acetyltransferase EpsC n=1 Tax=Geminocystis sp. CENA526 TaxID=1355871 RepID=UPI003D6E277E